MNTNKKPRRCVNTSGATMHSGRRPEYLSVNSILQPTGRISKGRFYEGVTKLLGGLKLRRGRRLAKIDAIGRFCPVYRGPRRPWRWAGPSGDHSP